MSTESELISHALAAGWEAEPVSLYDEECVEGWRWTSPTGKEFTCIGSKDALTIGDNDKLHAAITASLSPALRQ